MKNERTFTTENVMYLNVLFFFRIYTHVYINDNRSKEQLKKRRKKLTYILKRGVPEW